MSPQRIVIADNESIIRMDLRELLEEAGHQVVGEGANGKKAVELAIAEFSLDEKIDEKPFEETAKNFYSMIMGVNEMPEEEWKILEDVAKEVGIL